MEAICYVKLLVCDKLYVHGIIIIFFLEQKFQQIY